MTVLFFDGRNAHVKRNIMNKKKTRNVVLNLTDGQCEFLTKICGESSLTVGELISSFVEDLTAEEKENDRAKYANQWFEKREFSNDAEDSLLRHLLKNSYDPQDYLNDIEYLESLTEDKRSYAINNKEDKNYLDIIKEYDEEIITCKDGIKVREEGWKQKESTDMKKEIRKIEEWAEEKNELLYSTDEVQNEQKNISLYFVSCAHESFLRKDMEEVFKEGSVFLQDQVDDTVTEVFTNLNDAKEELKNKSTTVMDNGRYIDKEEYALIERVYDLESVLDDNDEIHNEEEFINALKEHPNDFGDYEVIGMTYDIIDYSKLNKWVKVYDENDPNNDERNYFVAFEEYSDAMRFSEDIENGTYDYFMWHEDGTYDYFLWQKVDNDLSKNEIIAKILFDDKDCSVATKFEYGTPYAETMTSDEFDEVFEKRLNKFIENERSGQSM